MLNNIAAFHPAAAALNSYESIQTVTVGGSPSSAITFTSIPSTYKHLQIRGLLLNSSGQSNLAIQFNSDTGSNYSSHQVQGDGSSTAANAASTQTNMGLMGLVTNTSLYPFVTVIDILDYQNTSKNKTIRGLSGQDGNASGTATNWRIQLSSGAWYNSSAVTSITIFVPTWTLGQYSSFALYGIKG